MREYTCNFGVNVGKEQLPKPEQAIGISNKLIKLAFLDIEERDHQQIRQLQSKCQQIWSESLGRINMVDYHIDLQTDFAHLTFRRI